MTAPSGEADPLTRAAASAGRGPFARWTGRRLFAAAERGDPAAREDVARIAAMPDHRLCERARAAVAFWWAKGRDPFLRQVVLDVGAVAATSPEALQTLALLGRLGATWGVQDVRWAALLVVDDDPDVRDGAAAACREASGPLLERLWREATLYSGSGLREALLTNEDPPPGTVLNDLWAEWIKYPSEPLWTALAKWQHFALDGRNEALSVVALASAPDLLEHPRYRRALIEALTFGDHPLYGIAERKVLALRDPGLHEEICAEAMEDPRLTRFCMQHKLAPREEARRALFFLMTGQPEQRRAMDPDGTLLSLAYASASEEERLSAQGVMLNAGELDLVRVIVGDDRRARIPALSHDEVRYLAEQLAARREWADLWAVVQDVPIGTGVELFRLFDGWVPRDGDTRRIFEMYLETDPSAAAALEDLADDPPRVVRQARFLFHGRVNDVSFAPDGGPYLAAAGTNRVAGVFDLRNAELVDRYGGFHSSVGRVLFAGDGALIAGERTNRVDRDCRVMRCADGAMRTLHKAPGSITSLASRDETGGFVAGTRAGQLLLGAPGGGRVRALSVQSLKMGNEWPRSVAAHPASGRLAMLARGLIVTDAAARNPVVACSAPSTARAAFIDADRLICADPAGNLTRVRRRELGFYETGRAQIAGFRGLAVPSGTGEPVIVDRRGGLYVLDPETSATTRLYSAESRQDPTSLTVSPGGDFLAVGDAAGHTDLFDLRVRELPHIVERPLVDLVPWHIGVVGAALRDPALRPEARSALQLLHACLEHRFRFDVEIGDAVQLTAGEHDVSL